MAFYYLDPSSSVCTLTAASTTSASTSEDDSTNGSSSNDENSIITHEYTWITVVKSTLQCSKDIYLALIFSYLSRKFPPI